MKSQAMYSLSYRNKLNTFAPNFSIYAKMRSLVEESYLPLLGAERESEGCSFSPFFQCLKENVIDIPD